VIRAIEELSGEQIRAYTTFVGEGGPRFWLSIIPEQRAENYAQILVHTIDKHMTQAVVAHLKTRPAGRAPFGPGHHRATGNGAADRLVDVAERVPRDSPSDTMRLIRDPPARREPGLAPQVPGSQPAAAIVAIAISTLRRPGVSEGANPSAAERCMPARTGPPRLRVCRAVLRAT